MGGQAYLAKRYGAWIPVDRLLCPCGWGIRNFKGRQGVERDCYLDPVDRLGGDEHQTGEEEMASTLLVYTVSVSPQGRRD